MQEYGACPIQSPAILLHVQCVDLSNFGVNRQLKAKWKKQLKEKWLVD